MNVGDLLAELGQYPEDLPVRVFDPGRPREELVVHSVESEWDEGSEEDQDVVVTINVRSDSGY